ncbi:MULTISPECIES: hypothetical protein [Bacillus cereus group]|nr:hypothetical protein [Bacillus thuringiensis]
MKKKVLIISALAGFLFLNYFSQNIENKQLAKPKDDQVIMYMNVPGGGGH